MGKTISAMEARQKFGEILNRVSLLNEVITIERSGKKIAKLVSTKATEPKSHSQGKLDFRTAVGLGKELWNTVDIDEYLQDERNSWD